METLGPMTLLPVDMLRPEVLLCCGEDPGEWLDAMAAQGRPAGHRHAYRGVHARADDRRLMLLAPWGSAAVEAVLWELTAYSAVQRVILWGTAGALPDAEAPVGQALAVEEAVHVGVAAVEDGTLGHPTMALDLPGAVAVSTDRFYGASPAGAEARYGSDRVWRTVAPMATLIDMETAPFFDCMERFAPGVERAAVRVVANDVADPKGLTAASAQALHVALQAAVRGLDEARPPTASEAAR